MKRRTGVVWIYRRLGPVRIVTIVRLVVLAEVSIWFYMYKYVYINNNNSNNNSNNNANLIIIVILIRFKAVVNHCPDHIPMAIPSCSKIYDNIRNAPAHALVRTCRLMQVQALVVLAMICNFGVVCKAWFLHLPVVYCALYSIIHLFWAWNSTLYTYTDILYMHQAAPVQSEQSKRAEQEVQMPLACSHNHISHLCFRRHACRILLFCSRHFAVMLQYESIWVADIRPCRAINRQTSFVSKDMCRVLPF